MQKTSSASGIQNPVRQPSTLSKHSPVPSSAQILPVDSDTDTLLLDLTGDTIEFSKPGPNTPPAKHPTLPADDAGLADEKLAFDLSGLSLHPPAKSVLPDIAEEKKDESDSEDWWRAYNQETSVPTLLDIFSDRELKRIAQLEEEQTSRPPVKYKDSKQKKLMIEYYGEGAEKKEQRLDIVMGLSGSGKSSTIVRDLQNKGAGALLIDSDKIKEKMPEYDGGKGAQAVHSTSASIAGKCLRQAMRQQDNIIYPTVGSRTKGLKELIEQAKNQGYKVRLHLAHLPPELAAKRVFRRMTEAIDKREPFFQFVSPALPLQDGYAPRHNFEALKNQPEIEGYSIWDTARPKGKQMSTSL